MLFQKRFHRGVRDGAITLTFRAWQGPKVRAGETYRVAPLGLLRVDAIDQVRLGEISARQARAAGFQSAEDLIAMLRKSCSRTLTSRSMVFRVRFQYCGPIEPLREKRVSTAALDEVAARLERMDRLSRRPAWTRAVLRLIARNPATAASRLAPRARRETSAFKADVRKLKGLGLTRSLEVGYELTALGEALLKSE